MNRLCAGSAFHSDAAPNQLPCENRLLKNKPRLLMVIPWMIMGGADKLNLDVVEQLTQRGWEVTIATTLESDDPWHHEFACFTPDIFMLHRFLRLVDYPRFLRYLIQSREPDVVLVCDNELGYLLLPYLRAYCPEPAYVDLCHSEEEHWKKGGYPRLSIGYQELLDLSVVVSEHLKRWMIRQGGDASRIKVCYANIDPERWAPDRRLRAKVRRQLGIQDEVPLILYAGRLCLEKQPKVFAQVMRSLREQGLEFVALVAGDGEDRAWLEGYVDRHVLGRYVRLLGPASIGGMRELMAASDIFFLPSKWEGIALTLYEAMACGLAVVGADVGGQSELVTEGCGMLLPPGEEQAEVRQYAQVLAQLLKNPDQRAQMGQQAQSRICEHFRLETMVQRMIDLFEEARLLPKTCPRPAISPGLGLACATQAVEYIRSYSVVDWLWLEQQRKKGHINAKKAPPIPYIPRGIRLYTRLYGGLWQVARPFYLWGVRRGWQWPVHLKDFLKRSFQLWGA